MAEIYQPAEDSFFLGEFVKKEILKCPKRKILDMGSGSGIQAETAIDSGAELREITLADLNPLSVAYLRNKFPESKVVISNLFDKINGKFDLIIFNPPYLPENEFDAEIDTTGGNHGSEIINEFLSEAGKYLTKNGKVLLLTSSLTENIEWRKYHRKLLGKKKIFFEELYVWELKKSEIQKHKTE